MQFTVNWLERISVAGTEIPLAILAEELYKDSPSFERVCEILEAIAEHYADRPSNCPIVPVNRVRFDV